MHILILVFLLLFSPKYQERKDLVIIHQRILVSGYTSIGKFNCDFSRVGSIDTLKFNSPKDLKAMEFQIPVKSFSCGNFILNNDFRSTLKADEFPFAKVVVSNFREKSGKFYCHLFLDLVGKKLEFPDLELEKSKEGLNGKLILDFDRLNLSPPSKLGGLVKVENQLDLELLLGT
jgi:hypothetical protein